MRHSKSFNHLGRKAGHRNAMLANMASSLILHKRITTTTAKAKALRVYVEPLITKSKDDSTHSRRVVFSYLQDKDAVTELFREVSPKVMDRPGGYTRILKTGTRVGDAAEMCVIELVDYNENMLSAQDDSKSKSGRRRRGRGKKTQVEASAGATTKTTAETATETEEIGTEGSEEEATAQVEQVEAEPAAKVEQIEAQQEVTTGQDEAEPEAEVEKAEEEPVAEAEQPAEEPESDEPINESDAQEPGDETKSDSEEKKTEE